jgi:hypothetical protein
MSYLTTNQFDRIETVMIALPQTELRQQRSLHVATIMLSLGQRLELRSLNLHLLKLYTPGVLAELQVSSLGLVSVGLYLNGGMLTGGLGLVTRSVPGVSSYTTAQPVLLTAPGAYKVIVSNNSNNVDVAVVVTGSAKRFY